MPMTRRHVLTAAAGGALAMPFVPPAGAAARGITVAAFAGDFQAGYEAAVIDPFRRARRDIDVFYYPVDNSLQILSVLRRQRPSPRIDVVLLDAAVARAATDEGLLEPIGPDALPVLAELMPAARIDGIAGPAVMLDNLVLLFSPRRVSAAPTSWKTLWDPSHGRQLAITAPPDRIGLAFTLIANRLFGGGNYRESVAGGVRAIAQLAPRVLSWDPRPDPYAFVAEGDAAFALGWNAQGQTQALRQPGRLAAAIPDEGSLFQVTTINLVKDAPQPDAARAFIAHALDAEAQKAVTERLFYNPVNPRARIDPKALARTASTPTRLARMMDVDWAAVMDLRGAITQQWRRTVPGLR